MSIELSRNWTITGIAYHKDEERFFIECGCRTELLCTLHELQEKGQDMRYVTIFPPESNATYEEIGLTYEERIAIHSSVS